MYYWLKESGCYGVYVISDDSDRIYHVQDGLPTQMKPPKQCFLKFKPYMGFIKKTETCFSILKGRMPQNFGEYIKSQRGTGPLLLAANLRILSYESL